MLSATLDQVPFSALCLQRQVSLEARDSGSLLVSTVEPGTACRGRGTEDDKRICVSGRSQLKSQTRQTPRLRWKYTCVAKKQTLWELESRVEPQGRSPSLGSVPGSRRPLKMTQQASSTRSREGQAPLARAPQPGVPVRIPSQPLA